MGGNWLQNFRITHIGGIPIGSGFQRPKNSRSKGGTFADRKQERIDKKNETANTHPSG